MNGIRNVFRHCIAVSAVASMLCACNVHASTTTTAAAPPKAAGSGPTLDGLVNSWLGRSELQHSFVGVEVMELPSGTVLFSSNGSRRFAPASTTKVMSTACAFTLLGPGYTYKTQLVGPAPVGDTVGGDLTIVPSQDPSFSRLALQQMLAGVTQKQIKNVSGGVRLEHVPGGFEVFQPNWLIEDFGQEYMPVCSNFVVDRNIAQGVPNLKGVRSVIENGNEHFNAVHRSLLTSEVASGWVTFDPKLREVRAYIGSGVSPKSPLPVADPDEYNTALAADSLQQMGVKLGRTTTYVAGDATKAGAHPDSVVIAEHVSKPLSNIIQTTLHESDNLYAQQLVRTLGLPTSPGGKISGATLEDSGLGRLSRWMTSIGVPSQEAVLFDGCGLSRKNGISPHALNMVLKFMAGPKVDGPYLSLLKHSGTPGRGQFLFKTGSMDTVRSISGVVQTVGGQSLAVTVIVNDHVQSVKNLRGAFGDIVQLLNQIQSISYTMAKPISPDAPPKPEGRVQIELAKPAPAPRAAKAAPRRHTRRHR